jgi:V-type H+-transporting ATPase subunit a
MSQNVRQKLDELKIVLTRTKEHRQQLLANVALHLENWRKKVTKEKWIYHTMNLFNYDVGHKCLIGEGWCPTRSIEEVQLALRRARDRSGALVPSILNIVSTKDIPPTYFKTNKFTAVYQDIVDAYGIARYREVNPAVFSTVTFPFLFAVMFGDVGHGFLLLAFAIYLLTKEKQYASEKPSEVRASYKIFLVPDCLTSGTDDRNGFQRPILVATDGYLFDLPRLDLQRVLIRATRSIRYELGNRSGR